MEYRNQVALQAVEGDKPLEYHKGRLDVIQDLLGNVEVALEAKESGDYD